MYKRNETSEKFSPWEEATDHTLTLFCISFAIRLSGRKVAIKLIDWLIEEGQYLKFQHWIFSQQSNQNNNNDKATPNTLLRHPDPDCSQ